MPYLFQTDPSDDDTLRNLTLVYDFTENIQVNGTWFSDVSRLDSLDYVVTLNNMETVLHTQYYVGFPLAMDTESWDIGDWVIIDSYLTLVVDSDNLQSFDCWICEIDPYNGSMVSYDSVTGILVELVWLEIDMVRIIELQSMEFDVPLDAIKDEGVLLTAIFIELAVIVWLLADRMKKSK